jgi:hypothetical protein
MILQEYKQKRIQVRKKTYTANRQKNACILFIPPLSSSELKLIWKKENRYTGKYYTYTRAFDENKIP